MSGSAVGPRLPRYLLRPALVAAFALGLAALVVGQRFGAFVTDTTRDVYLVPGRVLADAFSAWSDNSYLGAANYDNGLLPVALVAKVLAAVGTPAWLAARLVKLGLLLAGALGAARCYRWLRLPAGPFAAGPLAAGVVYVANPFAVVGGATLPVLLPYAVLPWLVVALTRALSRGTWRASAAAALLFALMGGQNAGVVPLLLVALLVPVVVVQAWEGASWRRMAGGLLRFALLALLLSAYWLVPALSALGAGTAVAGSTETPASVAATSSYAEVLRGLGLWTIYGGTTRGPFEPRFAPYLVTLPVVVASFLWPVVAACGALGSRARGRLLPVLCVLVGAVVAVGSYPAVGSAPFGRALSWAFAHVPGAIAFRTTVKAGPLVGLGLTVLVALAVATTAAGLRRRPVRAVLAGTLGAALLVGWSWPMLTGGLYRDNLPVPAYWHALAADLDAGGAGRVLFLPGQVTADYRWGAPSPDDVASSLLDRPAVIRTSVPATTPPAAAFLAAMDLPLQTGTAEPGALSMFARYLGATDVVIRNDVVWQYSGGARPATVVAEVGRDPGLVPVRTYGEPGQYVVASPAVDGTRSAVEAGFPPLLREAVAQPRPAVRADSAAGALVVDGGAEALPGALRAGLLAGDPAVLLASDLTGSRLAPALRDAGRIVLTDTNRRRTYDDHLVAATGPLLAADAPVGPTRALFGPDAQTVLALDGGASSVTASASGSVFGPVADTGPALAFDGDPSTAWRFGDFGTAKGQSVTLRLASPRPVATVTLRPLATGPVRPTAVRVTVDGGSVDAALSAAGDTTVQLPAGVTDTLTVTVTGTTGAGINGIGFSEISLPGVTARAYARLPVSLVDRLAALTGADRTQLGQVPLDVDLARDPVEHEAGLDRGFRLPDQRTFGLGGTVRPGSGLSDAAADRLAGVSPRVRVTASSRLLAQPQFRGSAAFDGNPLTQWVPDGSGLGAALVASFPPRTVRTVTVTSGPGSGTGASFTTALLQLGSADPLPVRLSPGTTVLDVPPTRTGRLTLTVTGTTGNGSAGIADIDVGGRPVAAREPRPAPCVAVGRLDGSEISLQPAVDGAQLVDGGPVAATGCRNSPVRLGAGDHRLVSTQSWVLDDLRLADVGVSSGARVTPAPAVHVLASSASRYRLAVPAAAAPYLLTTGTAYDPRWQATVDGRSLGPPQLLDGFTVGWRVDDPSPHTFVVRYGPQRRLLVAVGLSAAVLVGCLAVVLAPMLPARGRRRR